MSGTVLTWGCKYISTLGYRVTGFHCGLTMEKETPAIEVRPVEELLDEGELNLTAANGATIPYEGWIEVEFWLSGNKGSEDRQLLVPILVACVELERPIIGFNVIEELVQRDSSGQNFHSTLSSALEVGHKKAKAILSVLKKQKHSNGSHITRLGRQHVVIPKHKVVNVSCGLLKKSVVSGSHAVLEPNEEAPWPWGLEVKEQMIQLPCENGGRITVAVENTTDDSITLQSRTVLGGLHAVDVVHHLEVNPSSLQTQPSLSSQHSVSPLLGDQSTIPERERWDPPVDLSHLTVEQQQRVREMLREECDVFARDDWDTGCIPDLQMTIQLKDNIPVRRTYNAIPQPL